MRWAGSVETSAVADADRAAAVLDQAHDRAQHRGLAGAVRAEQRHRLALPDVEADVAHDVEPAVAGEQGGDLQGGAVVACHSPR